MNLGFYQLRTEQLFPGCGTMGIAILSGVVDSLDVHSRVQLRCINGSHILRNYDSCWIARRIYPNPIYRLCEPNEKRC